MLTIAANLASYRNARKSKSAFYSILLKIIKTQGIQVKILGEFESKIKFQGCQAQDAKLCFGIEPNFST